MCTDLWRRLPLVLLPAWLNEANLPLVSVLTSTKHLSEYTNFVTCGIIVGHWSPRSWGPVKSACSLDPRGSDLLSLGLDPRMGYINKHSA